MASGLQTFVAAVRSIATYVAVSLYVALIGTPLVLIAIVINRVGFLYTAGRLGVRLGLFLRGIRFVV